MQEPMIYVACDFRRSADGTYMLDHHYVAAPSSAHAEQILREDHPEAVEEGTWFIQTDEHKERNPQRVSFSVENDGIKKLNDHAFQEWIDLMTVPRVVHRETEPAAFRPMASQKKGEGSDAVNPAMLEAVANANMHLNNAGLPSLGDMLKAVQSGTPAVIGFDIGGKRQHDYNSGWNGAMDKVFQSMEKTFVVQRLIENAAEQD